MSYYVLGQEVLQAVRPCLSSGLPLISGVGRLQIRMQYKLFVFLGLILVSVLACVSERNQSLQDAFINVDFKNSYPQKYWISDWRKDNSHPAGFRYKLLSARLTNRNVIEFVVVLEERTGKKTEMKRLDVEDVRFDEVSKTFVSGLEDTHKIHFDELDLSHVKNAEEFDRKVTQAGWYEIQ